DLDLARIKYTSSSFKSYMMTSYKHILEVAKLNLFDCLAHLDYPKRYMALHGLRVKPCDYMEIIEEILKTVIANGKGIEVNCSGLRHRVREPLPNIEILKLYKSLGGEIITVGSDAHRIEHAFLYVKEAYEVMKEAGFDYITLFDKRIPKFVKF
ncbi:MAG: histidinol phosphate phosphatase, partial [Clostridia bacterium]|nr:histidinol phosphate phosphatase [Clostridia bacterium]